MQNALIPTYDDNISFLDEEQLLYSIKSFLGNVVYSDMDESVALPKKLSVESWHNFIQECYPLSGWPVKASSAAIESSTVSLGVHSVYGVILIKSVPSLFQNNFMKAFSLDDSKEVYLIEEDYNKISELRVFHEIYKPSSSEAVSNTIDVGDFVNFPHLQILRQSYVLQFVVSLLNSMLFIINFNLLAYALPNINSGAYHGVFSLVILCVLQLYFLRFVSDRIQNNLNANIDEREESAFLAIRWGISRSLLSKIGHEKAIEYSRTIASSGRKLIESRHSLISLLPLIPIFVLMFIRLPVALIVVVILISLLGVVVKLYGKKIAEQKAQTLHKPAYDNESLLRSIFSNLESLNFLKHTEFYRKRWSVKNIQLDGKVSDLEHFNKSNDLVENVIQRCVALSALVGIVILVSLTGTSDQGINISSAFMTIYVVTSLSMMAPRVIALCSSMLESKRRLKSSQIVIDDLLSEDVSSVISNRNVSVNFQQLKLQHSCFFEESELLDLSISEPGFIYISGESGSGKSLLLRTIAGLVAPEQGSVNVLGVDPMTMSQEDRGRIFSYVGQDMNLLAGTLRDNLEVFSEGEHTDRELWSILSALYLTEAVKELPLGLDTPVTNVMRSFSTGEQQRIILAQALVKKSEILLFDEALSGVPADMEKLIIDNIKGYFSQIYFVSHREHLKSIADYNICLASEY